MDNYIAWIDDFKLLTVDLDHLNFLQAIETPPIIYWEKRDTYFYTEFHKAVNPASIQFTLHDELPIGEELTLLWQNLKIPVHPRKVIRTKMFDEKYAAPDAVLGPHCTKEESAFTVWSPAAAKIDLWLDGNLYAMNKQDKGIWSLTLKGDWHESAYYFYAKVHGEITKVIDPYAKSIKPNGEAAVLIDFTRTDKPSENSLEFESVEDAIIYEIHIRDATIHRESGAENKGKFLGLAEKDTRTNNGYSTGLSYIKELGVTHVQLLPFNNFARVDELKPDSSYNWGYDPLFFQVPEGSYSSQPEKPAARINECKQMIQTIHDEGIGVIQDVVLNHVFIMEESDFEKLVPGYYFRYDENGNPSNGTGVGNDFATERKMARKFIIDTIDFWLAEYQLDGFRFDLMGSMDIETIQQIEKRCQKENRNIILLGEGWDLPTALPWEKKAIPAHSGKLIHTAFFNDYFRDTLKGNLFETEDLGYINGAGRHIERLPSLISGSVLPEHGGRIHHGVNQTINYVECHDNHTLWDRLTLTNKNADANTRKKMHQLATGLTLLSQGVPFIHAGQEFYRTKYGVENSYISGDRINQLDWSRREIEDENVQFVKRLIKLRKENSVFRLKSKQEIRQRLHPILKDKPVFGYALLGDTKDFAVYINPAAEPKLLHLPSPGNWRIAVTNLQNDRDIEQPLDKQQFFINSYEFIALEKIR